MQFPSKKVLFFNNERTLFLRNLQCKCNLMVQPAGCQVSVSCPRIELVPGTPACLSWCWNSGDAVAFSSRRGPLFVWVISGPESGVTVHRDAHSFLSDISVFRWHTQKKGKIAFGHMDGSLSILQPGENSISQSSTFTFLSMCNFLFTLVVPLPFFRE